MNRVPRHVLRSALQLCLQVHSNPELSGAEKHTAAAFAAQLESSGATVTRDVGGHGVVGVLANGTGPTVLLRAELDALPVQERTGLPYASTVPGVAHACGHDLHLAAVAGATALLAERREEWSGTVLAVGQPAEETLTGAQAMFADGLYERFGRPDAAYAQHTAPLPAGSVAHGLPGQGALLAGSRTLRVVVHGSGGHAGTPHLTVDPVVVAAAVVLRLQSIVARETAPAEQLVVTVGSISAGEPSGAADALRLAGGVVPDRATLLVSLRAATDAALDRAEAAVERVVRGECAVAGAPAEPDVNIVSAGPALVPDEHAATAVRRAHTRLFGRERVLPWPLSMASEDFARFAVDGVPIAYWMLGVAGAQQWRRALAHGEPVPANHAPGFAPDVRSALPTGIEALVSAAQDTLGERDL